MTKFYTFTQSNTGGDYIAEMPHHVIIEAENDDDAEYRAFEYGIDFSDNCPCCGYRWTQPWNMNASEEPYIPSNHAIRRTSCEFEIVMMDGSIFRDKNMAEAYIAAQRSEQDRTDNEEWPVTASFDTIEQVIKQWYI